MSAVARLTIKLHPVQAAFLDSAAQFRGFVGGRGCGKTWVGAYDMLRKAEPNALYMAVTPTYTMLKDACWRTFLELGNELRFIANVNRSDLRIVLGNGAEILFRSGDEADRLRGPSIAGAWLDEASVMDRSVFDVVIACLRHGGRMGWLSATFTPKGRQHWTYEIFGKGEQASLFHASTLANPFLPHQFYDTIRAQYTSFMAQQELEGLFVDDVEGALWRQAWLDAGRVHQAPPLMRIVVAIDPATTHAETSDDTGIAVAGIGDDGHYYVLHCRGYRLSPDGWARRALDLYDQHQADRIIAERNNGGEMVEATLRNVRPAAPVSTIQATRGKALRAEPIAALYEQGRVHHVGTLAGCEEQMCAFPVANEHDDMVDALVYALTDLVERTPGRVRIVNNPFYS